MDARDMTILMELLETSESESDEEVNAILLALNEEKPKTKNYISETVAEYSDVEFKKNFRVTREIAYRLIEEFEASEYFPKYDESKGGSVTVAAETHILSFLWYAGNKSCIRSVAGRFNIGESTLHRAMNRVMDYLIEIAPQVILFPKTCEAKRKLSEDFQKISGFPNVLGCIDGTYINMRTPAHKIRSTYNNRHDAISITLQAICDSERRFLDVFTGTSSKIHDARVFKLSFISDELPNICGETYHLLGDAAYPLREWMLTPYRDYGNLSEAKKNYNYKLSATRVLIENAFGLLKQRFRHLVRLDFHAVDTVTKFIISCCVLHNLCINEGDIWEEQTDEFPDEDLLGNNNQDNVGDALRKRLGEDKRERICNELHRQ